MKVLKNDKKKLKVERPGDRPTDRQTDRAGQRH